MDNTIDKAKCEFGVLVAVEMGENDAGVVWIGMNGSMMNLGILVDAKFDEWVLTTKFY